MHCYTHLAFVPACDNAKKNPFGKITCLKLEKRCHLFINMLRKLQNGCHFQNGSPKWHQSHAELCKSPDLSCLIAFTRPKYLLLDSF